MNLGPHACWTVLLPPALLPPTQAYLVPAGQSSTPSSTQAYLVPASKSTAPPCSPVTAPQNTCQSVPKGHSISGGSTAAQ